MELVILIVLLAILGVLANTFGANSSDEYRSGTYPGPLPGIPAARRPDRARS